VTALAGMTTLRAGESGATRAAVSAQRTSELSTPGTTDAYTPRKTPDEAKTLVETATDTRRSKQPRCSSPCLSMTPARFSVSCATAWTRSHR
jgi:hypothetical protein